MSDHSASGGSTTPIAAFRADSASRSVRQRASDTSAGRVGIGVDIRVVRMTLVAELSEDHEDLVGTLLRELDVLVLLLAGSRGLEVFAGLLVGLAGGFCRAGALADLDHGAAVLLDRLEVAIEHARDGGLAQRAPLVLHRTGQLVLTLVNTIVA